MNATSVERRWIGSRAGSGLAVSVAILALIAGLIWRPAGVSATASTAPAGQFQIVPADQPSVVVQGNGMAAAPADSAQMQILVRAGDMAASPDMGKEGVVGPPTVTTEQVQPVVDAIVAGGMPAEAVEVVVSPGFGGMFGPGTAQVLVTFTADQLGLMTDVATAATTAVQDAGLFFDSVNASYAVADCAPLLREARQAAVDDARTRAEALAEALGLTLGSIVLANEVPNYAAPLSGCTPPSPGMDVSGKGTYLPAFDPSLPAEVQVYTQLNLAYAIA